MRKKKLSKKEKKLQDEVKKLKRELSKIKKEKSKSEKAIYYKRSKPKEKGLRPRHDKEYSEVRIEERKGQPFLIARKPNGKIISSKSYNPDTLEQDILYYKSERRFTSRKQNKSYGKSYLWKTGNLQQYRKYNKETEKGKGVRNEDKYSEYILFIDGEIKTAKGIKNISRCSDAHSLDYPKERAYKEAEERFYSSCAKELLGDNHYDENEGRKLESKHLIEITDTYISYKR
jgi:hypothetical protein